MSIFKKQLLSFLLIGLVPALLGILILTYLNRDIMEKESLNFLKTVSKIEKRNIQNILDQNKERLRLVASRTQLRLSLKKHLEDPGGPHLEKINFIIIDALESIDDFKVISVIDRTGTIAASTDPGRIGTSPPQSPLHRRLESTEIFLDEGGRLRGQLSGPLSLDGEIIGTIVIETSLMDILKAVENTWDYGETTELLLASRTEDALRVITPLRFDRSGAGRSDENALKRLILAGQSMTPTDSVDYRGQEVIAVIRPFVGTDWSMVLKIDRSEAFQGLQKIETAFLFVVLSTMLLIVVMAVKISKSITTPLSNLSRSIQSIQQGDLPAKLPVDSRDEIGDLSQSFNAMTDSLSQTKQALVEKVEELRGEVARNQSILATAVDGIITIDHQGNVHTYNQAAERMFGYLPEDVIGSNVNRLMPPPFHGAHDKYISNYLSTGDKKIIGTGREVVGKRQDGTTFPMHLAVGEMTVNDDNFFVGILRDITEQVATHRQIESLTERQSLALEASKVGVWDWNITDDVLLWDDQMFQLYGISPDDFPGAYDAWMAGVHPEDRDNVQACIDLALAGTKKYDTEFRVVWPNKTVKNIRALATVLRDADDQPKRMLGVNWDITRYKQVLEELQHSNKELEQFAYISSHDLKAPLRAIDNLSKWIEEDSHETLSEASKGHLATLRGRVQRMSLLIEDLLRYSKIGHNKYAAQEVDVRQLLEEIVDLADVPEGFRITIRDPMPTLSTILPPLKQIFMNLIGNSIKHHHHPSRGTIVISSREQGDFYEFSVTDNGPGIPRESQKSVFNMFQTLNPRDTVEGSGMGLAFIDKITRVHGGSISLESEPQQGATFRVLWPKKIEESQDPV